VDISGTWLGVQIMAATIVSACFIVSGAAKVRDVGATAETFQSLDVPSLIDRRWVHRSYAWIELVLGIALLVAPTWVWWPVAVAATLMLAALTALVARVLVRADAVSCNCFGTRQPLTRRSLIRNALLLAISVILVVNAPNTVSPLISAIPDDIALVVSVVLAVAAAITLTALSRGGEHPLPDSADTFTAEILPIPELRLLESDGNAIELRSLVTEGAALIVFVKHGCGPCDAVVKRLNDGDKIGGRVVVRLVERLSPGDTTASRSRLWDAGADVVRTLGLRYAPSALLLASDGTIPSNPVYGADEIGRLVEAIEETLERSAPPDVSSVLT
jgi:hypothetical protein